MVVLQNLTRGRSKSCGCQFTNYLGFQTAAKRRILRSYKTNAKKRNIEWELEDELALKLMFDSCHYCGVAPSNTCKTFKDSLAYNGIDRKNNELFYRKENSVTCCQRCNFLKGTMLYSEFLDWARSIAFLHPLDENQSLRSYVTHG